MGRIRSIKPAMLSDEKIATLSSDEFRCFIGLILLSDDYGNCRASPNYVSGQIFWGVSYPVDTREILAKLSGKSLVTLYEVNSQAYLHICGWSKHQRVDHPGRPDVPKMDESREILANDMEVGIGRGLEFSKENSVELVTRRVEIDEGDGFSPFATEVIAHYSMFHPKAKPGQKEKRLIRDRMREKYTCDDLKRAIDGYHISPFHCGVNERGTTYLGLSLILRDSSHVQKGIELAEQGVPKGLTEKSLRAKFAVDAFLKMGKKEL